MKKTFQLIVILVALFIILPLVGLWLFDHALGSLIGLFVGMIILQYMTKDARSLSDADI